MADHAEARENLAVLRDAYEALSDRDFDALAELAEPDWVFDFSRRGSTALAGARPRRDRVTGSDAK